MAKLPYYIERRLDVALEGFTISPGFPMCFFKELRVLYIDVTKFYVSARVSGNVLLDAKRPPSERYLRAHTSDFASCHPPWLGFSCLSPIQVFGFFRRFVGSVRRKLRGFQIFFCWRVGWAAKIHDENTSDWYTTSKTNHWSRKTTY